MTRANIKRALIKRLAMTLSIVLLLGGIYYSYQFHENNKNVNWPSRNQIQQSFYNSVEWLSTNYPTIKNDHNSALWWMVKEAGDDTGNKELKAIFQKYKTGYLDVNPTNVWTPYFDKYYQPLVPDILLLNNLAPYQIFFIYALSCDKKLGNTPMIKKQLKRNFCRLHYVHPRCITHQLMSVRLMQEHSCGNQAQLAKLSKTLQAKITDELTYDFRATDSYIQRVLMLAWSDNYNAIKPVWVKRILVAQNTDGGWSDLQPILTLSNTKSFGWTSTRPRFTSNKSNFHTTAQGIWLMALLLQHEQKKTTTSTNSDADNPAKTQSGQ